MRLRQLFEAPRTAVMAFGRMNPPTIGHAKLVDAVKSQGGDPYIFLSQSQKPKTDPLPFEEKLRYAKFFFPNVTIGNPEVRTIIQALQKVSELGYENLVYVAGSDRVQSFEELINKYNGQEYNFKSIKVVSAGERDPDADGAEGMSASKMRAAAAADDLESFKQGVPKPEVADEMFAAVRQGMGIRDKEPVAAEAFSPMQWLKNTFSSDPQFKAWHRMYKQDPNRAAQMFRTKHKEYLAALQKAGQVESIDEGWFSDPDPIPAPEWLNDANKALWQEKNPTTDNTRLVTQLKRIERFAQSGLVDDANRAIAQELGMMEDAPPGRERQVKALKKKFDDPGAPYAIAWAQHNKHGKPSRRSRG